ncbi:hypothetical protein AMRN_1159 [Malaciobacter marinus]|uniref:Uncharacterized protein n=1 Tax=Malaciobacter marinus TaxID=505249 RepID=A0A347TJX8_9BACT|nr:hypothetical protein [Malaciobacter marinus]AXX86906.1 hypothetical protein AMRN_1159 [Malaciobacter marinus]PHO11810.1 hypothetical protein CPG38_11110 [Malaciobacter marinus]PHO15862.1 hypothetical protein CPH92_04630 [Malaciobacter marinus]
MTHNELDFIDSKIKELINDKTFYDFDTLKQKIEEILKTSKIFLVENQLNTKAVDMYLKKVITKRNEILKTKEKSKIEDETQTKYYLIETICKKYEFHSQKKLIEKIEYLEKKTLSQLEKIAMEVE